MLTDFIALFGVLDAARIRFVVVGGLALVLQGLDRLTADVDLVIDLSPDSAIDTVRALTASGYRPIAPVDPIALADPEQRHEWQVNRHMRVFSFWDSTNERPTVDVMLDPGIPFHELWADAMVASIGGYPVRIASLRHLLRMKEATGRPQDMADVDRIREMLAK